MYHNEERYPYMEKIFDSDEMGYKEFMNINDLKEILEKNNFKIISVEKKVFFPFKSLHKLNLCLEKNRFSSFCYFVIIEAKCIK